MASEAIILHRGFGSAAVDLQNLGVSIDEGDGFLAAFKFENAVQAYQTAGAQSVAVGQEINPNDPEVIQAASVNSSSLQVLQWHLASMSTAMLARSLAKQIQTQLTDALARNPQVAPPRQVATTTPKTSSPTTGTSIALVALWGAVIVGIGVMGYLIFSDPKEPSKPKSNPTGSSKRLKGGKALIAKGRGVTFELTNGDEVHCSGAMMHDPSGRWWPSKSVLVGPARLRESKIEIEGDARAYFGRSDGHVGRVNTPPKALGDWSYLGEVADIFYTRSGRRSGYYRHSFNEGLMALLRGKKRVRLYKRGRFYRLELPRGAQLDDRGFVQP